MTQVDCTAVPESVSDYAFDHLQDRLGDTEWKAIDVDYSNQVVTITDDQSGEFSDEEYPEPRSFANYLCAIISSYCFEKTNHMRQDAADEHVETPYTVTELDTIRNNLVHGCIQVSNS